jgi:D-lyxose ketol-isomerase
MATTCNNMKTLNSPNSIKQLGLRKQQIIPQHRHNSPQKKKTLGGTVWIYLSFDDISITVRTD